MVHGLLAAYMHAVTLRAQDCSCISLWISRVLVGFGLSDSLVDYVMTLGPHLASALKFQIWYAYPISLDFHQLYIVIVAKLYAWLQEPSRSAFSVVL